MAAKRHHNLACSMCTFTADAIRSSSWPQHPHAFSIVLQVYRAGTKGQATNLEIHSAMNPS